MKPIDYSIISTYWTKNPCSGGNSTFPFWFWKNRMVLEVGTGTGVDAERFIKAGAFYTGIDLTQEKAGLGIIKMNAEFMDFPDNRFDLVYSFGVIHHALNPEKVVNEIHRVLKPSGIFFLMLYNKNSFRYKIEIKILRKILWFLRFPKYKELRRETPNPTEEEWLSWNTDNLGCPISRVYDEKDLKKLLHQFTITNQWTENKAWFRLICAKK